MAIPNGVHVNGNHEDAPYTNGHSEESLTHSEETMTSPYTTRAIDVKIGLNGTSFQIFEAMVDRYPGLRERMKQSKRGALIELPEIDEDIGHTLVHFIFTGHYHTLGLGGVPESARATAEFKKSVLAYCAARVCVIDPLEDLTKSKMEYFSKQLSIIELQEVVVDVADRLLHNEVWFPEHLYRWVKSILKEGEDSLAEESLLPLMGKSVLFDKALFKSILEMLNEHAATIRLFTAKISPVETQAATDSHVVSTNGPDGEPVVQQASEMRDIVVLKSDAVDDPCHASRSTDHEKVALLDQHQEGDASIADPEIAGVKEGFETDAVAVESITTNSPALEIVNSEVPRDDDAAKASLDDSDVEAAREKTAKKSKKNKHKKKATSVPSQSGPIK